MNGSREISGRGLAVCDRYDAVRLVIVADAWTRAWIRYVDDTVTLAHYLLAVTLVTGNSGE